MLAKINKYIEGWAVDTFYLWLGVFIFEWAYLFAAYPEFASLVVDAMFFYAPLWGPIALLMVFWLHWKHYIQRAFKAQLDHILLEIKLPREQVKSPLAMELVLAAMNQTGSEPTFIHRSWRGNMRAEWSLELVSLEGQIHFFIRCRRDFKSLVENQLYAQFPGIEINEVPDYARQISYDEETMSLWGIEYKFSKADPYPIKTYIDYGLDKDPKEEYKIDPMTVLLEHLGALGKGEYLWVQMVMRGVKPDYREGIFQAIGRNKLQDDAQAAIRSLLKKAEDATGKADFNKLTQGEKLAIAGIERSLTKRVFEVGIRSIYFAKNENFVGPRIPTLITFFNALSPVDAVEYNALLGTRWLIKYDFPWQDFRGIRQKRDRRKLFDLYRRRAYFGPPYNQRPLLMTTEELATIFHFPGEVATTPSLPRVPSRRATSPANLPV